MKTLEEMAIEGDRLADKLVDDLMKVIDNCDFPAGVGSAKAAMGATQSLALERLVVKLCNRWGEPTISYLLSQIASKVLA